MATVESHDCDDCPEGKKHIKEGAPRYQMRLRSFNVAPDKLLQLPFIDLCAKCANLRITQLGGTAEVWTQEMLNKLNRDELREIAKKHDVQGRQKKDLIASLTGKPLTLEEPKED